MSRSDAQRSNVCVVRGLPEVDGLPVLVLVTCGGGGGGLPLPKGS